MLHDLLVFSAVQVDVDAGLAFMRDESVLIRQRPALDTTAVMNAGPLT